MAFGLIVLSCLSSLSKGGKALVKDHVVLLMKMAGLGDERERGRRRRLGSSSMDPGKSTYLHTWAVGTED